MTSRCARGGVWGRCEAGPEKAEAAQGAFGDLVSNYATNHPIQQYNGPKLDIKNAVTILISADFLKIDRLVKECLDFFVEHIEEISKVQVDMGCINS